MDPLTKSIGTGSSADPFYWSGRLAGAHERAFWTAGHMLPLATEVALAPTTEVALGAATCTRGH